MKVYYTSDTHSYIFPTDYIHPGTRDMGYAHLASAFEPGSVVIDGGDVLQGSPVIRYSRRNGMGALPSALCFNAAHLDVFVPGNHDFDFGYDMLLSFISSLSAVTVAANVSDERGLLPVLPHVVIERDGVRLFITGAVTDYVNVWDGKMLSGLKITDSVEALRREAEAMRAIDHDWSICVYHGGSGNETGVLRENRADEIAELGFDYLLTGHQHQVIQPHRQGSSIVLQAGCRGEWAGELTLGSDGSHSERIIKCSASVPLTSEMLQYRASSIEKEVDASLSAVIGHVDGMLEDRGEVESAVNGSSLADFINDLQLGITGADVSAASLVNNPISLGPDVTLGSVIAAYPFANNLVLLSISAGDLRKAMERSASFIDSDGGVPVLSAAFSPGKAERYNFDFYRGLGYTFDYTRKQGERVIRMERNGVDLIAHPDTMLTLVINGYRATGTGGYDVYTSAEVVRTFSDDLQDALIEALSHPSVKVPEATDFRSVY